MLKFNLQKIKDITKSKNKEFCSDEYLGAEYSYKFKCLDCNKIFIRKYSNFTQNDKCPLCKKAKHVQYNKLNILDWQNIAKTKNLTILSLEYINARTALEWKCQRCSTRFHNSPCNIKAGSGCPKCANRISKSEEEVRKIFEKKFNKKFPSIRPNFLKNPKTKMNLELDGYCEELKLAFEYDGEFHYKENPYREGALKKQQKLDKLKDALCKLEMVKLIRVPYTEKNSLEKYIEDNLKSFNEENK